MHPHTKNQIKSNKISLKGIDIINPIKYSEMLTMLSKAKLLLTDSGGLQKEAFWFNTPCVTIRENTEWIETLVGNHNTLLQNIKSSDSKKIMKILKSKPSKKITFSKTFGDGMASKKITSILFKQF
jgi:UDP-N-acetylglucosamine 2-epimerase